MFRETRHSTAEEVLELIRALPEKERKVVVRTLTAKPKLTAKAKRKQEILNGIADGLREIQEAKRTGKQLPELKDLLHEFKNKS